MAHLIHSTDTTASALRFPLSNRADSDQQHVIGPVSCARQPGGRHPGGRHPGGRRPVFGSTAFDLFIRFWPDAPTATNARETTRPLAKAFAATPAQRTLMAMTLHGCSIPDIPVRDGVGESTAPHGPAIIGVCSVFTASLAGKRPAHAFFIPARPNIRANVQHVLSGLKKCARFRLFDAGRRRSGPVRRRNKAA